MPSVYGAGLLARRLSLRGLRPCRDLEPPAPADRGVLPLRQTALDPEGDHLRADQHERTTRVSRDLPYHLQQGEISALELQRQLGFRSYGTVRRALAARGFSRNRIDRLLTTDGLGCTKSSVSRSISTLADQVMTTAHTAQPWGTQYERLGVGLMRTASPHGAFADEEVGRTTTAPFGNGKRSIFRSGFAADQSATKASSPRRSASSR